jgi:hypothetical protein
VEITIFDVIGDTAVYENVASFALSYLFVICNFHLLNLIVSIEHRLKTNLKIVIVLVAEWLFDKIQLYQKVKRHALIAEITNGLTSILNPNRQVDQPTNIFNRKRIILKGVNDGQFHKDRSPPKTYKTADGMFKIYRRIFNAAQ